MLTNVSNVSSRTTNPALGEVGSAPAFAPGAEMDPQKIFEMLKAQLSPEAAQLLELLVAMLQSGQNPFAPPAQASAAGEAAPGGGHEAKSSGGVASPQGKGVSGDGFLWKPQSESDGNLVVLLPPELRGKVDSVEIQDASGRVLESGRFAGDQKNGGRPHFRFDHPGAAYGEGLRVVAKTSDGQTRSFDVGDGASRHD